MASVTVQKWGTAAACRGQCIHVYREGKGYANPDIDPDKSGHVWVIGTAKECQKNIRENIAKIDKNRPPKRVKKDRKTVAELCVPAPREGTSQEDAMRFFAAVYDELDAAGYHVCGGAVHGDEVHDYIDPDDRQLHRSRLHMHVLLVPETDRGINMKSWLTKSRFRALNSLCDRVCKRELGHPYQDGSGRRSRGTVEALKEKSGAELLRSAEAVRNELPLLEASRDALRAQEAQSRQDAADAARKAQETRERAQAELRELFPVGRAADALEEREYKTGLLSRERVLVATDPDAVTEAVRRADAVARTLDARDALREDADRDRDAAAYQSIVQVSRHDKQLRDALVRSGVCPDIERRQSHEHSLSL